MLMRKTPQQGAIWHSSEPLGICGPSRRSQKTQFLVSDRDTVRIRRKTLPTTMMALNLDFEPLRQFRNWILADLIGIGRQSPCQPLHHRRYGSVHSPSHEIKAEQESRTTKTKLRARLTSSMQARCSSLQHLSHLVVEGNASVFKLFLKMNVSQVTIQSGADIRPLRRVI